MLTLLLLHFGEVKRLSAQLREPQRRKQATS